MRMPACTKGIDHPVIIIPGTEKYFCTECQLVIFDGPMPKTTAMIMQEEVEAVLRRYSFEGDISVYEALGVFRMCELNLIDRLKASNKR